MQVAIAFEDKVGKVFDGDKCTKVVRRIEEAKIGSID